MMTASAGPRRYGVRPYRRSCFTRQTAVLSAAIILVLAAAPALPAKAADPPPERVLVTDVIDGDTIKVLRGRRQDSVRFIGVDTPETGRPDTPVQFYGPEASLFTRRALLEKRVRLEFEPDGRQGGSRDKYHRLLAYVFLDDGRNFNLALIEHGFGKAYTRYPFRYEQEFRKAEQAARAADRGMWNAAKQAEWSDPARRGQILGNLRTDIYHLPGQRYYSAVGEKNVIHFRTEDEALKAGFRKAKN